MERKRFLTDWQFWTKVVVSLGIAVGFGYWVQTQGIRLVPPAEDMVLLWDNWWGVTGFAICLVAVHFFRAYRWVYLLRPLAREEMKIANILAVAFVGFMAIMTLPLRTGEFVRPYLISTRGHMSMSSAFGTIAIERVLDGLVLSGILTLCLLVLPIDTEAHGWARPTGLATLGLFVVAMVVLIAMLWKGEPAVDFLERLGARIWPSLARRIAGVLREFLHGLTALPSMRHVVPFLVMTLVYWGINGVGMWLLAISCGLGISVTGGFAIMTMLGVGILLPTGPGHFGNFQVAVWLALSLQGFSEELMESNGSVYIFTLYFMILGTTVGAGAFALLTRHVSLRKVVIPNEGRAA